jgi:hypothetical protein
MRLVSDWGAAVYNVAAFRSFCLSFQFNRPDQIGFRQKHAVICRLKREAKC